MRNFKREKRNLPQEDLNMAKKKGKFKREKKTSLTPDFLNRKEKI